MKTIQSKYEGGNDDTMRTIQSNFQNTGKGDTLAYSGTMAFTTSMDTTNMKTADRLKLKKLQESQQREQELKSYMKDNAEDRNFAKNKKKFENLGASNTFQSTTHKMEKKYQH